MILAGLLGDTLPMTDTCVSYFHHWGPGFDTVHLSLRSIIMKAALGVKQH